MGKMTIEEFKSSKKHLNKLAMLTAYDFNTAVLCDQNEVDAIVVGDSLGRMIQGCEDSRKVTVTEMMYHTRIVGRGVQRALLIADMPFESYETPESACENASVLINEGGADAVMMEGRSVVDSVAAVVEKGIPVIGLVGMDYELIQSLGPFSARAEQHKAEYMILLKAAQELENAGCFAVVLRTLPATLAKQISLMLKIPVIGMGSGRHVDGQMLNFHDMMGITDDFRPRHVKRYAYLSQVMQQGVRSFCNDVERGLYPSEDYEY